MMGKSLVDLLDDNRNDALRFLSETYAGYDGLVEYLVKLHASKDEYEGMDPERITAIDHGDYQGTRVFVVGGKGYQPSRYWYVKVGYGSCSGCDAYEDERASCTCDTKYTDAPCDPSCPSLEGLYALLHDIASGFREMNTGDEVA
jgi:hypothetical protein